MSRSPAGFVPSELVYERWSFSFPEADCSATTVTITSGGLPLTLAIGDSGAGDQTSSERSPFIVWEPSITQTPRDGTKCTVTIKFSVNGQSREVSYDITIIEPRLERRLADVSLAFQGEIFFLRALGSIHSGLEATATSPQHLWDHVIWTTLPVRGDS